MANSKWKFIEPTAGDWTGGISVPGMPPFLEEGGLKCFYADNNPTGVSESNTSTVKEIQTIDGEDIRINTFRDGDNKRVTRYDIKLEFQSQAVYKYLKYIFNNGKYFKLYNNDPISMPNASLLYLAMDDFSVDWVALQGTKQVYGISLKCRDIETDPSGNPIKWAFEENDDRSPWDWSVDTTNGGSNGSTKFFLTNHSPSSTNETFSKRGQDVETINGTIVRVNPIRIKSDGSIEKIPGTKTLSVKLDYQTPDVRANILNLYNNANEFNLYASSSRISSNKIGVYVIADYNIDFMSIRGTNRLYGISLSLREVEVL